MAQEAGKTKVAAPKKEINRDFYREVEEKVLLPLSEAMQIQDKIESYAAVDQVLEDLVGSIPEEEVERRSEAKAIFKELKEKVLRDAILDRRHAARRPRSSTRSARSGSRSACCRARTARPSSRAARRRRS